MLVDPLERMTAKCEINETAYDLVSKAAVRNLFITIYGMVNLFLLFMVKH